MKEKFKKIGIVILFILFILSGLCLLGSCITKTKTTTNKLASACAPKMALYRDNSSNHYVSNNLFSQLGTTDIYTLKDHILDYNSSNLLYIDTIRPNFRNPFGGNNLKVYFKVFDSNGTNAGCRIYFTSIECSTREEIYNLPAQTYSYQQFNATSASTLYEFDVYNGLLSSDNIYVYLIRTNNTNNVFNGTNISFEKAMAFTYHTGENLTNLKTFDLYGLFVPSVYNDSVENALKENYLSGYSTGYSEGVDYGFNNGYLDGYQNGIETAENGDFNDMITAVADTPLKILYNFFNFEILGVNLWVFFTSILSILIVMFIIKKIK